MSVGHGILLLVRAGSTADPHKDSLSSVDDEHCNRRGGVMKVSTGDANITTSPQAEEETRVLITAIPSLESRQLFGRGNFPSWARDMLIFPLSSLSLHVRGEGVKVSVPTDKEISSTHQALPLTCTYVYTHAHTHPPTQVSTHSVYAPQPSPKHVVHNSST